MKDETKGESISLVLDELAAAGDDQVSLGDASSSADVPYKEIPYDPAKDRESMRGKIALSLIAILAGVVALSYIFLFTHPDLSKDLRDVVAVLFAPLIGLVGAATGYYFGAEAHKRL